MEKELKPKKAKAMEEGRKYSYEQLDEICSKLYAENQRLKQHLSQLDQYALRVDFLLKTIELADKIKDAEFITECIEELKSRMTLPKEGSNNTVKEKEA